MPKLKTKKAAAARFKVTGSGKIVRRGRGIKHLLEHLSSRVKRRRAKERVLAHADENRVRRMLPYQ
jgi:large subunit ribosomal protein L35